MSITIDMIMDEAHFNNDREAMQAIGAAYYHWFSKSGRELTPETAANWRNTPVIEILKEEVNCYDVVQSHS